MVRWLLLVMMGMTLAACGRSDAVQPQGGKLKVVCTVAMVTDVVRHVAGDKAQVEGLLGEGVDPHLYKPTRDDIVKLRDADVIFYSGLLLEGKMTDALVNIASGGKTVVAVTSGVDEQSLIHPAGLAEHADPHVWMNPALWTKTVDVVADTLSARDPANAATYKANAAAYRAELMKLHEWAVLAARTVPDKSRVVITSHDAFNYFGKAYGFEVRGIQGISTESEAGLKDIEGLVNFIVDREIRAVFVESSVSEKNVRALLEGAKARGKEVKIGGTLFSDAMGRPGTYEGTYIGMIDHNVTTVVRALGGTVEPRGYQGKLGGAP